jgi:glycosyltransferase involved in cell wall biosynthesis
MDASIQNGQILGAVNVLLGVHNGSRFLSEQLQSLDNQSWPPLRITIRDDWSTDDSLLQVREWASSRPNVTVLSGPCLGAIQNFFTLLSQDDDQCDCFAFCDQDDVWLPDKLDRAVRAIRDYPPAEPVMYCSRVEFVDERLRHLGYSSIPKQPSFANALVQNIATGCTVVLNRTARDLIVSQLPRVTVMHDWWCYLVTSAFGSVHYDQRPTIKYRQHARNVTGGTSAPVQLFVRRVNRFLKRPWHSKLLSDQADEFRRCFGAFLSPQQKILLDRFLTVRGNLRNRLSYNLSMDVWRQTWLDTAILRMMIVIGRV